MIVGRCVDWTRGELTAVLVFSWYLYPRGTSKYCQFRVGVNFRLYSTTFSTSSDRRNILPSENNLRKSTPFLTDNYKCHSNFSLLMNMI